MASQPAVSAPLTEPARRYRESLWIERILRRETVGGFLLLAATVLALIAANTGLAESYVGLRSTYLEISFGAFSWEISVGKFAADALLAIFFFLAGLELKREFVAGELRDPRKALVPVVAAVGGVVVPAIIFLAIVRAEGPEVVRGWAIPVATDIAFALAVLAVVGTALPIALRTFLLTLAVVDDLIAITIIAFFYTTDLQPVFLLASLIGVAVYGLIVQRFQDFFRERETAAWFVLLPLGVLVWFFMFESGVHATVAGVLLAFTVPVRARGGDADGLGERMGLAEIFEHRYRPLSAGIAVPVFAFFSAGVAVGGWDGLVEAVTSPLALGIIVGLVVGKTVGITVATWLVTRIPGVSLPRGVAWIDLVGLALLAGMGFTVSLLINELSFGQGTPLDDVGKVGILLGSLIAALLAVALLGGRNRHYRRRVAEDAVDADGDGIPDIYDEDRANA
ncbi:Na+/H+ antiporter NhaA [Microcella frigidaquae]|uniref:Na(+)/H(+) antiporter NhaA n=1 Tax=Microcella frigidaquae TaxID=424758 RepID=A0A840X5Z2_9MICO|nr:Na+/H+ antiporter NhaA [Microcella frigidaquae]MBB5616634.1 NhaA family Na+:H+ antiporter [Microcella frigidaquae]NHN43924.1 Na+/H+ antiporter NhaA [Microcella frigidaquae]